MKNIFVICLVTSSFLFSKEISTPTIEKVSLQLKWKYQFQSAGFIIAKEKGFYKEVGLDVDILELDINTHTMENLREGKIDFAVSDSAVILEAMTHNNVVAMMAILQNSPYSLMALKSSGIKSLKDIENKKIALYENSNGMSIDAMLLSNHINHISTPVAFSLDTLVNGQNDIQTVYLSSEPYIAKERGLDIVLFHPKDYGFDGYGDIVFTSKKVLKNRPDIVEKMYLASKKGWEYAFANMEESVEIIYHKYNSLQKSKKALMYEAKTLKSLSGIGENFAEIDEEKIKSIAQIFSFIKKGIYDFKNLDHFIYQPKPQEKSNEKPFFTKQELEYIESKKKFILCSYKDAYPFVIFKDNIVGGITMEYLKLIKKKSQLNFEVLLVENMQEHLKMIDDGRCDVSPMIVRNPNMYDFLVPSLPVGSDLIVLATKITEPYVNDLNDLTDEKIAILKGGKNVITYVKSLYPNMNLVEVDYFDMKKIENGQFYGQIGASYQISYLIATEYLSSLKIMSKIGNTKVEGSLGVTIREPILLDIINKVIADISNLEKQNIENAWLRVNIEKQFDYILFLQIMSVTVFVLVILLFSFFKQKNFIKKSLY